MIDDDQRMICLQRDLVTLALFDDTNAKFINSSAGKSLQLG